MGASWIHGIGPGAGDFEEFKGKNNPIYDIATSNNIKIVKTWDDQDNMKSNIYWWK